MFAFASDNSGRAYLSFTVGPEINSQCDRVVDAGIRGLIEQDRGQSRHWEEDQPRFDAAVDSCAGDVFQRPLPGQHDNPHEQIDGL